MCSPLPVRYRATEMNASINIIICLFQQTINTWTDRQDNSNRHPIPPNPLKNTLVLVLYVLD